MYSNNRLREKYHATFVKYIRIKQYIWQKVDDFHFQHMKGKYCVGVHMRNIAQHSEQPKSKCTPFTLYIDRINDIINSTNSEVAIFLSTDVEDNIEKMRSYFGDKVIFQKGVTRLPCSTNGTYDDQIHHNNQNPSTKLGEDVLIDVLLLSKCDTFVHITSNISTAVWYINPKIKMVYCE